MECKKCGKEFEGNFCPHCGAPLNDSACPKCGKEREPGTRYCSNCGFDFQPAQWVGGTVKRARPGIGAKVKSVPKKAWIMISVALVAAVTIVLLTMFLANRFRIGVVERIAIGDSKQQVIDLLGEPYDYNENSLVFEYYSDNFLSLLEESDNFNPDDIEDFDDLEGVLEDSIELEQRLQTEEYKYIEVCFDNDGYVTSVFFDNSRTEATTDEDKTLESYEILNIAEDLTYITYKGYYTDGSYYLGDASITLNIDGTAYNISWYDYYGNEMSHSLSENATQYAYDEDTGTLHIIFDDSYPDTIPTDLKTVIIHDGVTNIPDNAFRDCDSLTSVTIPDSVTSIGDRAFYGCPNIVEATMPALAIDYISKNSLQTVIITSGTSIGDEAFSGCSALTSITIPDSVTSIGDEAFSGCSALTSITIPDSVTSIGDRAFSGCSALTSITIPDSVTSIGESAFEDCSGLTSITIPDGVTSIGSSAFRGCSNIVEATMPALAIDYIPQNSLQTVIITSWLFGVLWLQRTDKHYYSRRCDEHWLLGVLWLQRTDKHYHTRQRDEHWRICVRRLQQTDEHNYSRQCDEHWRRSVLWLQRTDEHYYSRQCDKYWKLCVLWLL